MESSSNKAWSWRNKDKAAEQTSNSVDQVNAALVLNERAEMEAELKSLRDKLLLAQNEGRDKDELVKKHASFAQEAIAGWEKAETGALSIREALEIALQQCRDSEERCDHLEGALRECMQQLHFVGEQQEQRIHDVLLRAAAEFEKTKLVLEDKLLENGKKMSRLGVENTRLSESLVLKDKMIQEMKELMTGVEADCNLLKTRLDMTKKENSSLKYEVRVLEKELEIRNEEREFNRRAVDASHRKQLEYVKKLAKLESECQRLRALAQKQFGTVSTVGLAKRKDATAMPVTGSAENRQTKMTEICLDDSLDTPNRRVNSLTKDLYALEEENSNLKKTINQKVNELQMSKAMYVRTAARLSHMENLLEVSKVKDADDTAKTVIAPQERAMSVLSDLCSDDKSSCTESQASALNLEIEVQGGKGTNIMSIRPVRITDMNLMDDFIEMEKLALVYSKNLPRISQVSSDVVKATSSPIDTKWNGNFPEVSSSGVIQAMKQSVHTGAGAAHVDSTDWVRGIIKLIMEQQHLTKQGYVDLLGEIQAAMESVFTSKGSEPAAPVKCRHQYESPKSPHGNNSTHYGRDTYDTTSNVRNHIMGESSQQIQPNLADAVCKMIDILEGMHLTSSVQNVAEPFNGSFLSGNSSEIDTGYMVRVFQWKSCELSHVVLHLIQACNDLLNGKDGIEKFVVGLTSAFDWIVNHCFSIQDVSSMRNEIKKYLGWDDTRSECETEVGSTSHLMEATKFRFSRDQASPKFLTFNGRNVLFEDSPRGGSQKMNDEWLNVELAKKDMETKLQDATDHCETLHHELLMSEKTVLSLQKQVETLKESKRMAENQTEKHMFANEELHSQLTEAKVDLNETFQKIVSLQVELENKSAYCEDLEATCVELQLQLQSLVKKEHPNDSINLERQLLKDWEFATASEKLAECQETILNLGRQLKAIASPMEAPLFDKAIVSAPPLPTSTHTEATTPAPTTPIKKTLHRQRTSLLEKMLAEDDAHAIAYSSPKTKEMTVTSSTPQPSDPIHIPSANTEPLEKCIIKTIQPDDEAIIKSLVVLQSRKRGGWSLWRRLFRRKRGISRKLSLSSSTN